MRTNFITNNEEIKNILKECKTCYLGLCDADLQPYVVPMNFSFSNDYIYLHSGQEGRKWELLNKNPKACITFCLGDDLAWQDEKVACSWRVKSQTVIAEGTIEIITNFDDKVEALNIFMRQYSDKEFKFSEPAVKNVGVFRMKIETMAAKEFGAKAPTPWKN